jgi:hypothetical protein
VDGYADSLAWGVGTTAGAAARIDAAGRWRVRDSVHQVWFDTLQAGLATHTYRLLEPAELTLAGAPSLTPVSLRTPPAR